MEQFRIIQDGMVVASTAAHDRGCALAEIEHYAAQYAAEGTIRLERKSGKGRWREYLP